MSALPSFSGKRKLFSISERAEERCWMVEMEVGEWLRWSDHPFILDG